MDLIDKAKSNPDAYRAGAIGCFIGLVRGVSHSGAKVEKLEYEADEDLAGRELRKIADAISSQSGVIDVLIHHNVDELSPGEDILYVVVLGKHRKDVFAGVRRAVEELKRRVPIWKKEFTTEGSYWIPSR